MNKNFFLLLLVVSQFNIVFSQIIDDFSDGDFTHNPKWSGDTSLFIINGNFKLQSNDTEAGSAYLSLEHQYESTALEWQFTINLTFAPSNNNYARFFLASNKSNLKESEIDALYLQFGENGSEDAISLFYLHNGTSTMLCRGENGTIATAFNYHIKVIYEQNNLWKLFSDRQLNGQYQLECETSFPLIDNNIALGIFCTYTSSNSKKFFFDDIYFGLPIIDTVKPEVLSIKSLQDLQTVMISFSENITEESGFNHLNYHIENEEFEVLSCSSLNNRNDLFLVKFDRLFVENKKYTMKITGIEDYNHNKINDVFLEIVFYKIKQHDIVIHEIMAKPEPVVRLPDCEYIELKNCKSIPIELSNYKVEAGTHHWNLPDISIPADSFALIVGKANEDLYANLTNVYSIASMSITNSGQRISLYNGENELIHTVNFSEMWHQEIAKRVGGWSLEMIDSSNPCEGEENWVSSTAPEGGTPGKKNSVEKENPDFKSPLIEKISLPDPLNILLKFDEKMVTTPNDWNDYITIDRGIMIDTAEWILPEGKTLQITTKTPILSDKLYTLTIKDKICDCFGLPVQIASSIQFGLDNPDIQPHDLIINEIMTNPIGSTNSTYIELYNLSDKIIDLKNIKIGEGGENLPAKWVVADPDGCQVLPKQYVVLCKNQKTTLEEYFVPYPDRLLKSEYLPTFGKQEDIIFVTDMSLNIIDKLIYASSYHYELLTSTKGVSLEKINFNANSEDRNSWISASALSGYGTPGYKNSQYQEIEFDEETAVSIQPEIISPDGDGFDDYCQIVCNLKGEDNRISITIYNRNGYVVKKISNNTYCGTQSTFRWDGNTEAGGLVAPDLYIVKVEYWNLSGNRKTIFKSLGVR